VMTVAAAAQVTSRTSVEVKVFMVVSLVGCLAVRL